MRNLTDEEKAGYEIQINACEKAIEELKNKAFFIEFKLNNAENAVAASMGLDSHKEAYQRELEFFFNQNREKIVGDFKRGCEAQLQGLQSEIGRLQREIMGVRYIITNGLEKCEACGSLKQGGVMTLG